MASITKAQYAEAIAERDLARREAFDLKTRVQVLEMDLSLARRDIVGYRNRWNAAAHENQRLRTSIQRRRAR